MLLPFNQDELFPIFTIFTLGNKSKLNNIDKRRKSVYNKNCLSQKKFREKIDFFFTKMYITTREHDFKNTFRVHKYPCQAKPTLLSRRGNREGDKLNFYYRVEWTGQAQVAQDLKM